MKPVISADEAAGFIRSQWTVTTAGFGSCGHPEMLTAALERRFLSEGAPADLTLLFAAGQGDRGSRGLNRLAHPGLLKRVIGGYWALTPKLGELALKEQIEAYNFPQGVISHLFRAVAAGGPGVITRIGLDTFLDPRYGAGKLNDSCSANLIQLVDIAGSAYLLYRSFPIQCALIRGTTADANGNVSMEEEANFHDVLAQAQAARNSGGMVIVQVREIVRAGGINPHLIRVPGMLVDYIVKADQEDHWQTYGEYYNPAYVQAGQRAPAAGAAPSFSPKTIIARRAYLELRAMRNPVINLGIGVPELIAAVAKEEGTKGFTLTVESGAIGGYPAGNLSFGASENPEAIVDQSSQFDFYDGGGIDAAFLGYGEVDGEGNVNVGRLGERVNGVGGFVNISQSAKRLFFCGTFTARGLALERSGDGIRVRHEGRIAKFVPKVSQLSFSGRVAAGEGRYPMYITERAVFRLDDAGIVLTEVAPGIDIENDILRCSQIPIRISPNLRAMSSELFR